MKSFVLIFEYLLFWSVVFRTDSADLNRAHSVTELCCCLVQPCAEQGQLEQSCRFWYLWGWRLCALPGSDSPPPEYRSFFLRFREIFWFSVCARCVVFCHWEQTCVFAPFCQVLLHKDSLEPSLPRAEQSQPLQPLLFNLRHIKVSELALCEATDWAVSRRDSDCCSWPRAGAQCSSIALGFTARALLVLSPEALLVKDQVQALDWRGDAPPERLLRACAALLCDCLLWSCSTQHLFWKIKPARENNSSALT